MAPKRTAPTAAAAPPAEAAEPEKAYPPSQTIYIKNIDGKIKKPGAPEAARRAC